LKIDAGRSVIGEPQGENMSRLLVPAFVIAFVGALCVSAAAAPPQPVHEAFTIPAGAACAFPVNVVLDGKAKILDLPGGRETLTAPGQKVTLSNAETGASVHYVITGVFHNRTLANGDVVTQATGRNVLSDPIAGFVLTSGNFSYTTAPDGSNVEPLHGNGTVTDICAALS
jgi:hypothetical protein